MLEPPKYGLCLGMVLEGYGIGSFGSFGAKVDHGTRTPRLTGITI